MNYNFERTAGATSRSRKDEFDPYYVMDVPRDADLNEVRQRFRKLTRLYHPDRNKRNPNYDGGKFYAQVCRAYELLSDPERRGAYDREHAAGFEALRQRNRPRPQPRQRMDPRARFGEGDLNQFNRLFEEQRAKTANDIGYGDQMLGRMREADVHSGREVAVQSMFGGATSVSDAAFNERFAAEARRRRGGQSRAVMERTGEPVGWSLGQAGPVFTEVAIHDGMIVDAARSDFSKTGSDGSSLNYSDYMAGFETITEHIPEWNGREGDVKKEYGRRVAELSSVPTVGDGSRRSFQQAEQEHERAREAALAAERERNRRLVLRYGNEYSSDQLLPASSRAAPRSGPRPPAPRPRASGSHRPQDPRPGDEYAQLNARMMDRLFDPTGH